MTKYSIGIVTFEHRFDKFFKPLIKQIKEFRPDIEIMVAINGEYKSDFNQTYRKDVLNFISEYPNVFPNVHTEFRSLAKLWNNLLINASNHNMLLLNDDVTISSEEFFNVLEDILELERFFKINGSWSHTMLDRRVIAELNWFGRGRRRWRHGVANWSAIWWGDYKIHRSARYHQSCRRRECTE